MTKVYNLFAEIVKNTLRKKAERIRITKAMIYAAFGIDYRNGKIRVPIFGYVRPLLKCGNGKIGKAWHFSTLATNLVKSFEHDGTIYTCPGTCACTCRNEKTGKVDCYACAGRFVMNCVKAPLGINTFLARYYVEFMTRAIMAQIIADGIKVCRVHVSGDFFPDTEKAVQTAYIAAWRTIADAFPGTAFWSYTKIASAENAFSDCNNFHIVKSFIPGHGYNFGECGYIIGLYHDLKAAGKSVYICLCGIDDDAAPKCYDCGACRKYDYVLFVKHSTGDYDAKKDALFPALVQLALSQKSEKIAA